MVDYSQVVTALSTVGSKRSVELSPHCVLDHRAFGQWEKTALGMAAIESEVVRLNVHVLCREPEVLHCARGSSTSSARHAAYASAALMSSGSR
jgi:hypothetical protein